MCGEEEMRKMNSDGYEEQYCGYAPKGKAKPNGTVATEDERKCDTCEYNYNHDVIVCCSCFRGSNYEAKGSNVKTKDVEKKEDVVNDPSHYKHGKYEVIDEMILAFGPQRTYDFCIMNAWKYRARAPFKGKPEQDMAKADRYMEMARQIAETNMSYVGPVTLIKESPKATEHETKTYEDGCVDGYRNRMRDERAFRGECNGSGE